MTDPGTASGRPNANRWVGETLRLTWSDATGRPAGIGSFLRIAFALLISIPLVLVLLLLLFGAIAFGLAMLVVGWCWVTIRNLFSRGTGRGRDRSGRENVRVIVRR